MLPRLERWWAGSYAHDDRDKNEALDHDEYERFYARLVHLVDPDDEMTELEIAEAMEDDFRSDSEGHAQVTKDEFVASVFELADNWTNSTDADEYVEFLKLGYDRVYRGGKRVRHSQLQRLLSRPFSTRFG